MNHLLKKIRLSATLSLVLLALFACPNINKKVGSIEAEDPTTHYVGGIQINEPDQNKWAQNLKTAEFNLAQVTVYAKQGVWNSGHLWWHPAGPTYEDSTNIIHEIRALKSQNLGVIMVLRVALQHEFVENHHKWHGMILPKTKIQRSEWFYRYNYWVEMWSKICERENVEIMAIGSELNTLAASLPLTEIPSGLEYFSNRTKQLNYESIVLKHEVLLQGNDIWEYGEKLGNNLEKNIFGKIESNIKWSKEVGHTDHHTPLDLINQDRKYLDSCWRGIIANSRKYYNGKLTFAANFDNYHEINFWDELDFIGINAYFPLRKINRFPISDEQLQTQLVDGWRCNFAEIETFKQQQGLENLPLFFTEIGYTSKENCTTAPWKGHGYSIVTNEAFDTVLVWQKAKEKPEERTAAIRALNQVITHDHIPLEGISYWKLTTIQKHLSIEPFALLIGDSRKDELELALKSVFREK
jgi:hypothetical protein